MGYSTTSIPFMVIDETPIEVESASCLKWFNFKTLNDFSTIRGSFSETDKTPKTYIFENRTTGDFCEFKAKI